MGSIQILHISTVRKSLYCIDNRIYTEYDIFIEYLKEQIEFPPFPIDIVLKISGKFAEIQLAFSDFKEICSKVTSRYF